MAQVDWDACMGCGACESQCPEECVDLVRDERKGMPLDVRLLDASLRADRPQRVYSPS